MKKVLFFILFVVFGYFAHNEGWLDGTIISFHPTIALDLSRLSGKFKESGLLSKYPKLDWDCYDKKTYMGDRVCTAPIRAWNGVLAKYTAFFFNKRGSLNMVKFSFRAAEHAKVISALNSNYGQPKTLPGKTGIHGKPIVIWASGSGLATASENVKGDGEATMTWTSGRSLLEKYFKRMMDA